MALIFKAGVAQNMILLKNSWDEKGYKVER
jgi:hypothetical protein